ncbi:MAG: FHA domain-containing protein [Planctomycetota bacterium]
MAKRTGEQSVELRDDSGRCVFKVAPGDAIEIGRHPSNGWVVRSDSLSRFHARLRWDRSETRPTLRDLGSQNGTFLNGRRLGSADVERLSNGDTVRLGTLDYLVVFSGGEPTPAILEDDEDEEEISVVLGGQGRSRQEGTLADADELWALLDRLEVTRSTVTLRLTAPDGKPVLEAVLVVFGSLALDRVGAVRWTRGVLEALPGVGYTVDPVVEARTLSTRGWRPSEVRGLVDDHEDPAGDTKRIDV